MMKSSSKIAVLAVFLVVFSAGLSLAETSIYNSDVEKAKRDLFASFATRSCYPMPVNEQEIEWVIASRRGKRMAVPKIEGTFWVTPRGTFWEILPGEIQILGTLKEKPTSEKPDSDLFVEVHQNGKLLFSRRNAEPEIRKEETRCLRNIRQNGRIIISKEKPKDNEYQTYPIQIKKDKRVAAYPYSEKPIADIDQISMVEKEVAPRPRATKKISPETAAMPVEEKGEILVPYCGFEEDSKKGKRQ